jgi:hypothetical protein
MSLLQPLAQIHPDARTRGFWDACRRRELRLQRCADCGAFRHPPLGGCPHCASAAAEWVPVRGPARVFSYTVVHHASVPALSGDVPYNVVVVEFDDAPGARLISNLLDTDARDLRIGMELELCWDEVAPEVVLPRFRPKAGGSAR